jgi:amidase
VYCLVSPYTWAGAAGRRYRPVMDLDLATATAGQLTRAIRDRELSSRELLDHLLDRAGKINPQLNAIVAWDTERARAAADAADQATMRGEIAGPLQGCR